MEKRISRCGSSFWLKHRVRLSELWVLCGEDEVARGREEAAAELGIKCSNALILAWPTNLCVVTFGSQEVKELWLSTLLR
ncbi:rho GTPase-activating protein 20-like [Struthio camelus]